MPLINHFFAVATATLLDDMYTVSEADDFVMICANLTDGILDRTSSTHSQALHLVRLPAIVDMYVWSAIASEFLARRYYCLKHWKCLVKCYKPRKKPTVLVVLQSGNRLKLQMLALTFTLSCWLFS